MNDKAHDHEQQRGNVNAPEPGQGKARRDVLQGALTAIDGLRARLAKVEGAAREPIAIVGLGCRLPGGVSGPEAFWQLLSEGRDVIGDIPADRWDVDAYYDPTGARMGTARTKQGGFVEDVAGFEPAFFGMSPREATGVDPQQRLLLEVSWEALENAAIPPDRLEGSQTGVFVGITSMDYSLRLDLSDPARSDVYLATGTALNAAAGRISFSMGLHGPCMAIDTACSSSLVAVHTACQSLRTRECDLALVGGVNALLTPEPFVLLSKWGMLSPDGRCKAFDASANGFVRAEGCSMLVAERLSDAIANGRRILAVIRGSAINQDGKSSGLTAPNGLAQQAVVRQALRAAGVAPTDISYVEAHGTGTSLGDPIEVEALASVYGEGRDPSRPFEIGSVKSNVGHLEAASGATGLIKLVLAIQNRKLPASLHVTQPTPAIAWDSHPVRISTRLHDWAPASGRLMAGISAFGFSGMNAHAIVEEPPREATSEAPPSDAPQLLVLSARSGPALSALAERYARHLAEHPAERLEDVCATAALGRAQLAFRMATVATDRDAMIAALRASADESDTRVVRGQAVSATRLRTAFLFTGQGSQYPGMGRELYEREPAFRQALDRCAAVLDPLLKRSLIELMFAGGADLQQTGFTQPALFALEVSLASLWRSWGVEPQFVIGHSVGEFAAAVTAGVLSIEDGARLIAARGRLMQSLPEGGTMLAVQGDVASIEREVAAHAGEVCIAARNAPGSLVISGLREAIEKIATRLSHGMRVQPLAVSHAFHSQLMAPMLQEFRELAAEIAHSAPTITWISNLTGAALDWSHWKNCMAEYWTRHVIEPVAFERGVQSLGASGMNLAIEIGPNPVLIGLGKQILDDASIEWLPSLSSRRPALEQILESAGRLFVRGGRLDFAALLSGRLRNLALPTYPFQRQRYLLDMISGPRRAPAKPVHELLGEPLSVGGVAAQFERSVSRANPAWLVDHEIGAEVVMPMTAYLEAALAAARQVHGSAVNALHTVEVGHPMVIGPKATRRMQVAVDHPGQDGSSRVRIFSMEDSGDPKEWTLHFTAFVRPGETDGPPVVTESLDAIARRCDHRTDLPAFYKRLVDLGVNYGPAFQGMREVWRGEGESLASLALSFKSVSDAGQYQFHPALLDACTQVSGIPIDALPGSEDGALYLPVGIDRYWVGAIPSGEVRCHARIRPPVRRGELMVTDYRIETADGRLIASIEGFRCRRTTRAAFQTRSNAKVLDWLYELAWPEAAPAGAADAAAGVWLIFDDGQGRGERLAALLEQRGGTPWRVVPGADYAYKDRGLLQVNPASSADLDRALAFANEDGKLRSVVSFWPLRIPKLGQAQVPSQIQLFGTESAVLLSNALARLNTAHKPRLWFVTSGSQVADGTEVISLEQAPVAGVCRVAASEYPDLRVSLLDLDPQISTGEARLIADELVADLEETQVALRKGTRRVARLARKVLQTLAEPDLPLRLTISTRGTLENLALQRVEREPPGPGQIEIRVRASGLNFRDVLSALGMYPGEIPRLGSDCAGEVIAVGAGVHGFKAGDRVVAMVQGAFATHATARWEFVAPLPAGVSFEQGAAVPTAYLTAEITLNQIAGMKRGQRVLIHSGAGGVGMAAIALAQRAGAEIFATAGSPEKREYLARLGVQHVLDSRTPAFAAQILSITGGKGVDIVLNSLAGEMLDKSFEVLADGGYFMEIGKRGLWTHEQVEKLGRGIHYHIVDCNENARETPKLVGEVFTRALRDIESGALPFLPYTTFPLTRAADAFRYMAQAKHMGRVVLRHGAPRSRLPGAVDPNGTYLVTGGLKGLGLLTARWLADKGARYLLLAGRSAPEDSTRAVLADLAAKGVAVAVVAADVSTDEGVANILSRLRDGLPPLAGVIHAAGVLDDGMLNKQTPERFARVMGPKADGAWRLHRALTAAQLSPGIFVMYSSMAAVLGAPGQGNYVAANAFLDSLAQWRAAQDASATSIDWGAWQEVGMAARGTTVARATAQGIGSLLPSEGFQALETVLQSATAQVAVTPIDWPAVLKQLAGMPAPVVLRDLISAAQAKAQAERPMKPGAGGGANEFEALPSAARISKLCALIRKELATVLALGSPGAVADDQPFTTIGLDSLTAVELRNRLNAALGRSISATAAFEYPTVTALAQHLSGLFAAATDSAKSETREEFSL